MVDLSGRREIGSGSMNLFGLIEISLAPLSEWHHHRLLPFSKVTSINGQVLRGDVMRRRINGKWQYRAMTNAEEDYRTVESQSRP
jgi:hypothetical protein